MRHRYEEGKKPKRQVVARSLVPRMLVRRVGAALLAVALLSFFAVFAPPRAWGAVRDDGGIVATGHRDLDDLVEDRLLEMRGVGEEKLGPDTDPSPAAVALILAGTVAALAFLGVFLARERRSGGTPASREARRHAEETMASLAPRLMLLSEREKAVAALVDGETRDEKGRRRTARLLREAKEVRFWERFVDASSLVEEDPEAALRELHRLPRLLEYALAKLDEAAKAPGGDDCARRLAARERDTAVTKAMKEEDDGDTRT